MKKFHFPLERVRQWREKQVAIEEVKLEQLYVERRALEANLKAFEQERADNETSVICAREADAVLLRALNEYRRFAVLRAAEIRRSQHDCDQRIAAQRLQIQEVQRKVRLLAKLKERKRKLWDAAFELELEQQAAEAHLAKWSNR